MWSVWDKKTNINGSTPEEFLKRNKHLMREEVIFLKTVNGRVTNVEGKSILGNNYGIDTSIPDSDFITEYERILSEPLEEDSANNE